MKKLWKYGAVIMLVVIIGIASYLFMNEFDLIDVLLSCSIVTYIITHWVSLLLIIISGASYCLFNEMEDESIKGNWENPAWNTKDSWKNKWAWFYGVQVPYEKKWYHFGVYPPHKEAFPYSSTILVFWTDKEHLFQFIKNIFILIAIISWQLMIAFLIGRLLMSFVKEAFIKWLS